MVQTKDIATATANLKAMAGQISQRYTAGIQRAQGWQSKAIAGEANYAAGIAAAVANSSRSKGLAKVSDSQWQTAAVNKGGARIGPGVTAGADKYSAKFAPYIAALSGLTLPARTQDGMTNLTNRAGAVVQLMEATKKQQTG